MDGWMEESKEAKKAERTRKRKEGGKKGREEERNNCLIQTNCNLTAASPVFLRSKFCAHFSGTAS